MTKCTNQEVGELLRFAQDFVKDMPAYCWWCTMGASGLSIIFTAGPSEGFTQKNADDIYDIMVEKAGALGQELIPGLPIHDRSLNIVHPDSHHFTMNLWFREKQNGET